MLLKTEDKDESKVEEPEKKEEESKEVKETEEKTPELPTEAPLLFPAVEEVKVKRKLKMPLPRLQRN